MDVASPLTARTAGRTSLDSEGSAIFTRARKFIMLATIPVTNGWHSSVRYRDSHHPSATGQGYPSP